MESTRVREHSENKVGKQLHSCFPWLFHFRLLVLSLPLIALSPNALMNIPVGKSLSRGLYTNGWHRNDDHCDHIAETHDRACMPLCASNEKGNSQRTAVKFEVQDHVNVVGDILPQADALQ